MKRIVDHDPITGITDYFEYDSLTEVTTLSTFQDVETILEDNKLLQNNDEYTKAGFKKEFWHYATLPNILIDKWLREEGLDVFNKNHEKRLFQKLNSPDFKYLKATHKTHLPK